jgi:hypothetical protein
VLDGSVVLGVDTLLNEAGDRGVALSEDADAVVAAL